MYKKILVPLDGSKLAETALPHAESLAAQYGAELLLLSIVTPPAITTGRGVEALKVFETEIESLVQETEDYLKQLRNKLNARNIACETVVKFEPVVRSIVETANEAAVDLVIIASHGRSGLGRVFFGSVAAGVLNRIEQPLMVIRSAS
jgi:nucleotide-binding universal stress UspA family protein